MKTPVFIKFGFWALVLATVWIGINACMQGRLILAFTMLDESSRNSRQTIETLNTRYAVYLNSVVAVYNTPKSQKLLEELQLVRAMEHRYQLFLDNQRTQLLNATDYSTQKPLNVQLQAANTAIVKSLLLGGQPNAVTEIAAATTQLRAAMLTLVDKDSTMLSYYLLNFKATSDGRYTFRGTNGNFRELPLSGVLAILSDLQVAASISINVILHYCDTQVGDQSMCNFTAFFPFSIADSPYIPFGDTYKADVFFSWYPPSAEVLQIAVDGKYLPVKDDIAHYESASSGLGEHRFLVKILLGQIRKNSEGIYRDSFWVSREFAYEVISRHVSLDRPDSLNYLYAGVENPIAVSAWGNVCHNCLQPVAGGKIKDLGGGYYTITPRSMEPVSFDFGAANFKFNVRPLPDPLPVLANRTTGKIDRDTLAKQKSLTARFPEDFDFKADCSVASFHLTRFRAREDPEEADNQGANFNPQVRRLLETVQSGDRLLFEDIRVQCPGDRKARTISALSLRVQ